MKVILFLIKLPFRLIALVGALLLAATSVIAVMLINVGSFIMGPIMFIILGCGIFTVFKHEWDQTLFLFVLETACILILFASGTVLFMLNEGREALITFATKR